MTCYIPLGNKRGLELYAKIDDEDFGEISKFKWHRNHYGYAVRHIGNRFISMARVIAKTPEGLVPDHVNHDRLDNRRENLRNCTQVENNRNKKPRIKVNGLCTGVTWVEKEKIFYAKISVGKKRVFLGCFKDYHEAVAARRAAELQHFGIYAPISTQQSS